MTLPIEVAELMRGRPAVAVWLTVLEPGVAGTFDAVAEAAGIQPLGRAWREVDSATAVRFLTALLSQGLAYSAELMPAHRAAWLAEQFAAAAGDGARFATNSDGLPGAMPFSWDPATDATFDAGVVAIGPAGSVLYWIAEED